MSMLW